MSWLDALARWLDPTSARAEPAGPVARRNLTLTGSRALAGGRLSLDKPGTSLGGFNVVLPPASPEESWRLGTLDSRTLSRITPSRLMELLADLSPDVSRALWDFLRFCNPGWEAVALRPGSEEPDTRAQAALDAFLAQLADRYGSVDVVLGRLFTAAFLRGAFLAELVLDERGRLPVDLVTPDPSIVRFRQVTDPVRGAGWQLGQQDGGKFISLDRPTIRYIPIDPFPGSPYGRPLASPALFSSLFLIGLLHDLRRVISQQGHPRLDLELSMEKLAEAMPASLDDDGKQAWLNAAITEIQSVYAELEPDDAYVHLDLVQVKRPVGTVDSSSLGAIDGLVQFLERLSARALKSNPLMMGLDTGLSEATSNRLWEIHAAGVKSLQHPAETIMGRLCTLGLEAQGIRAVVRFRFAELRASELLRDAQTENWQIRNAIAKYQAGWISQDEASALITGKPADQPEPRVANAGASGPAAAENPEPGSNRSPSLLERTEPLVVAGNGTTAHSNGGEGYGQ
ncbi:MAG: hypothetical protein HY329_13850 [Chloroflexi bacterium]|nr:hypothetical protein [Chloroflexota bacterium]